MAGVLGPNAALIDTQRSAKGMAGLEAFPNGLELDRSTSATVACPALASSQSGDGASSMPTGLKDLASCPVDGVAEGWVFAAGAHSELWAWQSSVAGAAPCEITRRADALFQPPAAAGDKGQRQGGRGAPHERGGPRGERRGLGGAMQAVPEPAPRLPLGVASSAEDAAKKAGASVSPNAVAVVPAGRSDATVLVVSIVDGKLHGSLLSLPKGHGAGPSTTTSSPAAAAAAATPRLVSSAFLGQLQPGAAAAPGSSSTPSAAPAAPPLSMLALRDVDLTLNEVTLQVLPTAGAVAKRVSLLVFVRCIGSKAVKSAAGVLTLHASKMAFSVSCAFTDLAEPHANANKGRPQSLVVGATWLGDAEHHVVVSRQDGSVAVFKQDGRDRTGSSTSPGSLVLCDSIQVASPGASITAVAATTEFGTPMDDGAPLQRSVVTVVTSDNAVQVLHVQWETSRLLIASAYIFPPARETIQSVVAVDAATFIGCTSAGRLLRLGSARGAVDLTHIERPTVEGFDGGVPAVFRTAQGFVVCCKRTILSSPPK